MTNSKITEIKSQIYAIASSFHYGSNGTNCNLLALLEMEKNAKNSSILLFPESNKRVFENMTNTKIVEN